MIRHTCHLREMFSVIALIYVLLNREDSSTWGGRCYLYLLMLLAGASGPRRKQISTAETLDCHKFYFFFLARYKRQILQLSLKLGWRCVTEFGHSMWAEVRYIISSPGNKTPGDKTLPTFSHVGMWKDERRSHGRSFAWTASNYNAIKKCTFTMMSEWDLGLFSLS